MAFTIGAGTRSLLDRKTTKLRDIARELQALQLECGQTFSKENLDMALAEVELQQKEHLRRYVSNHDPQDVLRYETDTL